MAKVKVWNDNDYPHSEVFKGEKITIDPHAFIEMDWEEAIDFKGQFSGLAPIGKDGAPDPRFFKKIRVETPTTPVVQPDPLVCHANGQKAATVEELAGLLSQFASQRAKDPDAEKAAAASADALKAENEALKQRLAAIEARFDAIEEKRGPGRPRKEAVG